MSTTPNCGITNIDATLSPIPQINDALRVIDALLQCAVLGFQNDPPVTPADGDQYIVGTGTGAWLGQDNNLAQWVDEGAFWQFYAAGTQVRLILNLADGSLYRFDTSWGLVAGLADAPSDGTIYGRQNAAWVAAGGGGGSGDVVGPASSTAGNFALFGDATGKLIADGGVPGDMAFIDDAPSDGTPYARQDAGWVPVPGGGGGSTTFLGLTDTPAFYTGAGGQAVVVNTGETGLEFVPFTTGGSSLGTMGACFTVSEIGGATSVAVRSNCPGTITSATALGAPGESGSVVFDVKKVAYAGYSGGAVSICGGNFPQIISAFKSENTLVGWDVDFVAGDIFIFELGANSGFTGITLTLGVTKS